MTTLRKWCIKKIEIDVHKIKNMLRRAAAALRIIGRGPVNIDGAIYFTIPVSKSCEERCARGNTWVRIGDQWKMLSIVANKYRSYAVIEDGSKQYQYALYHRRPALFDVAAPLQIAGTAAAEFIHMYNGCNFDFMFLTISAAVYAAARVSSTYGIHVNEQRSAIYAALDLDSCGRPQPGSYKKNAQWLAIIGSLGVGAGSMYYYDRSVRKHISNQWFPNAG
jgi:hypothetical protein